MTGAEARGGKSGGPAKGGQGRGVQGRKQKRSETNFLDAHSSASELAPPPSTRDVFAIPAKLRRIMQFKASMASGRPFDANANMDRGKKSSKVANAKAAGKKRKDSGDGTDGNVEEASETPAKRRKGFRQEAELKTLVEKMDKRARIGKKSTGEKWKKFLNEKKGKGKRANQSTQPPLNQYEKIEFGDVVQAPPKLSFPKKASAIKSKEKVDGDQAMLHERLRLQAIEAYRQRKGWDSRLGQLLPSLDLAVAVPDL